MGVHDGHRKRVKAQFLEHGTDSMNEHQVLELLLFYAIPQGDVNPLAHRLMDRFGSLSAVLDAPVSQLMEEPGVGENTATLLKLVPHLGRRYLMARVRPNAILDSTRKAGEYLIPRFFGERDEVVYLVCLDAKCKVLSCQELCRGNVNSAAVSVRKIVEHALRSNATSVILAHNHTSGLALPSPEDERTTLCIRDALEAVDIELADHIVVAEDDFVSMADSGLLERV